jgi:ATP-binding cassette subfamily F protein 3
VIRAVWPHADEQTTDQQRRNLLARFGLVGDIVNQQVGALSGGERRRLGLAVLVTSGANLLLLDEPTNHLDLDSRETLETALEGFPGTVLLVSHDRALLDAVAGRTIAVEDHALRSYDGGWADLVATRDAEAALRSAPSATEPAAIRTAPKRTAGNRPKPPARSTLAQLEDRIDELEKVIAEVESQLADDWHNAELLETHRSARADLERLLARWESAAEESERTVRDAEG